MEQEKALEILLEAKSIVSEYKQIETNLLQNKTLKEQRKEILSKDSEELNRFIGSFWGFIVGFVLGDIISVINKGTETITSIIHIFQNKSEYFRYFKDSDTLSYIFNNINDFPELSAIFVSVVLAVIGVIIGSRLYAKIINLKDSSNGSEKTYIDDEYLRSIEFKEESKKKKYNNFWNEPKTENIKKYIPLEYMKEEIIEKFIEYIKMGNANNIEETINLYKGANLENIKNSENNFVSMLFNVHTNKFNKPGMNIWETLCLKFNLNWKENQYINELLVISKSRKEMAMEDINISLFQAAISRVVSYLQRGEKVIVYKDNGIFSQTGKVGELITNKRIFILKKRSVEYIDYNSIYSLNKASVGGSWYFNDNKDFEISDISCSEYGLGILLGLICMYVKDCHESDYKINVFAD